MQIVQRRVVAYAKHHFGAVIGAIAAVKTVDAAFKSPPTVVWHPGIALMIRLHRPAFAVDQAEPMAVFDLQPAFDIGTVTVFVLVFTVEIDAATDAQLTVKAQGGSGGGCQFGGRQLVMFRRHHGLLRRQFQG
ncbi:hypothetical protein D3C73_1006110 [compost metagenome]